MSQLRKHPSYQGTCMAESYEDKEHSVLGKKLYDKRVSGMRNSLVNLTTWITSSQYCTVLVFNDSQNCGRTQRYAHSMI